MVWPHPLLKNFILAEMTDLSLENPNPVLRFHSEGGLLFANPASQSIVDAWNLGPKSAPPDFELILKTCNQEGKFSTEVHTEAGRFSLDFYPAANGEAINAFGFINTPKESFTSTSNIALSHYRDLVESADDVIFITDVNGNFTYLNPLGIALSGKPEDEVLGHPFTLLIQEDFRQPILQFYQEQFKQRNTSTYIEFPLVSQGERTVWLGQNARLLQREDGYIEGFMAVARDITERKRAKEDLIATYSRLYTLIRNLYSGVILEDQERKVLLVNEHFRDLFGLEGPAEQLVGTPSIDVFSEKQSLFTAPAEFQSRMVELLSKEEPCIGEELELADGRIYLRDYIPIISSAANIGHLWQYQDITARKRNERALIEARERAEESSRAKEEFLANMSHEIRTPMNAITGISWLMAESDLDEQQQSYLNAIRNSAENLLVIINDILDFTKIEMGKLSVEIIGMDLRKVIQNLFLSLEPKALDKNIVLKQFIDPNIRPMIKGDPVRLYQILLNLLSNGLKFTHEGQVELVCEVLQETKRWQEIRFVVSDTGIGISPEKLPNIFDSFSQEDASITRKYGGTGLGLAISKQLIEHFGGSIGVNSTKGKGSTFHFVLKFEAAEPEVAHHTSVQQEDKKRDLSGTSVLLAEDHEINVFLIKSILERWHTEIEVASNGQEALEMVQAAEYDLVLMDMQMPIMSGIEATQQIRQNLKSDIPILALTANAREEDAQKCLEAGMNDYISKPFQPEELFSKITVLVNAELNSNSHLPHVTRPMISTTVDQLYNLDKLREMSGNDQTFVQKMVDLFLAQSPDMVNNIKEHHQNKNYPKLKEVAHKMKPSIDFMGIQTLHQDIRSIEKNADQQINLEELPGLIGRLDEIVSTVNSQLREEFYGS